MRKKKPVDIKVRITEILDLENRFLRKEIWNNSPVIEADKGVFWLPEGLVLTATNILGLMRIGLQSISVGDDHDCPGDQHPQLVLDFRRKK